MKTKYYFLIVIVVSLTVSCTPQNLEEDEIQPTAIEKEEIKESDI